MQEVECRLSELLFPYFAIYAAIFTFDHLGLIMVIMQTSMRNQDPIILEEVFTVVLPHLLKEC